MPPSKLRNGTQGRFAPQNSLVCPCMRYPQELGINAYPRSQGCCVGTRRASPERNDEESNLRPIPTSRADLYHVFGKTCNAPSLPAPLCSAYIRTASPVKESSMDKTELLADIDTIDVKARPETLNMRGQPVMLQVGVVPAYALTARASVTKCPNTRPPTVRVTL